LTPTEIAAGYELAVDKALEILPSLKCFEVKNVKDKTEVSKGMKAAVMSKQYGNEDLLSNLIADACSKLFYLVYLSAGR
jgi:T-complex protein 1 subunit theta